MIRLTEKEDRFNHKKTRTLTNSDTLDYNCGGLAFETFSWYEPEHEIGELDDIFQNLTDEGFLKEEVEYEILERAKENILNDFSNFEYLEHLSDADVNDNVVAFRIFTDPDNEDLDFHFRVRIEETWFEKCGGGKIRQVKSYNESPWREGFLCYDSLIYYFREKNNA